MLYVIVRTEKITEIKAVDLWCWTGWVDSRGSLLSLLARDLERAESQIVGFTFPHSAAMEQIPDPVHQIRLTTTNLAWPGFALIKIGSQGIYNYFAFLVALCKYLWLWEDSSEYKLDLILVHKNILLELKLTWSIRLEINCFQPSSYSIILSQIP